MKLYPHLSFNGTCQEAFTLYANCLGGEIVFLLTYDDSPTPPSDPALAGKVAHATLKVGDNTLSGVDVLPSRYEKPQGFAIQMNLTDEQQAQRIYAALSPGANIRVPLQKTYWADLYADLIDRFGTPWEINHSQKA